MLTIFADIVDKVNDQEYVASYSPVLACMKSKLGLGSILAFNSTKLITKNLQYRL